jgi:crotonobetainyl-CoA:carnitine CoA-transferase CaiB-like acyl-CoA transferase
MFETGLVVEVEHPYFGTIRRHGLPAVFSETPGRAAAGPVIGQHTTELLTELGYTTQQIDQLESNNLIRIAERT